MKEDQFLYFREVCVSRVRLWGSVVAIVALLCGCSSGPSIDVEGAAPVTISWFAGAINNSSSDPRLALIDAFEKAHPSIKVNLISAPTNTDEKRRMLKDTIPDYGKNLPSPDVYLGDVIWPAEFGDGDLALALNDQFSFDFWSRFSPVLVDASRYEGNIYSVPFYVDQGMLFYRKDLRAMAGLPDEPPATWEQLVEESRVLQSKGLAHNFVWQGAEYEGLMCVWTELAADAGVQTSGTAETGLRIDSPKSVQALRFMRSLRESGISPEEVTTYRETQALQVFNSGGAAFLRSWQSDYVDMTMLDGSHGTAVGMAPLPNFAGQPRKGPSTVGGWSLYINPETRHLPEVLTFIEWMTDTAAQYTIAQYSLLPANIQVRSAPVVTENPALSLATTVTPVRRPSHTPAYPMVSKAVYTGIHTALTKGDEPPEVTLRRIQEQINRILLAAPR